MTNYPESEKTPNQKKLTRPGSQLLVLFSVVLLYAGFIEWYMGWHVLFAAWRSLSPLAALVASAMILASYLTRAYRIHDYFRNETAGGYSLCVKMSLYHNLINTLLPFRSGELSFPFFLRRYFRIDFFQSGPALLWFRLLDLHVIFLLGTIVFMVSNRLTIPLGIMTVLLFLCLPFVFFYLHARLLKLAQAHDSNRLVHLGVRVLEAFPQTAGMAWRTWLISFFNWLVKIAALAFILMHFTNAAYSAGWAGVIAGDITSVLPIHAPGGFGTYAAGVAAGLAPWHIDLDTALQAGVNLHLFLLGNILLGGFVGWLIPAKATAAKAAGRAL